MFALWDPCLSGSFNEREPPAREPRDASKRQASCQKLQPGDSSQGKRQEGKEVAQMLQLLSRSVGPEQAMPAAKRRGGTAALV